MPNYQNSKIYKITCVESDDIYIGSTVQSLNQRLNKHISDCKKYVENNKAPHCTSCDIVKYRSAEITLICDFPCDSSEELRKKEREFIETVPNCINKCIPYKSVDEQKETRKQYNVINREKHAAYHKVYQKINKEKLEEYRFESYNCECGGKYKYHSKAKHMKSKKHIYFVENEERLKDVFIPKKKQIVKCPCGGTHCMKPAAIKMHEKSKKHIYYLKHGVVKPATCSKSGGLKCECGSVVNDLVRHKKSKKHQKYLQNCTK